MIGSWRDTGFGQKNIDFAILLEDAIDRQPATWARTDVALDLLNFDPG